MSLPHRVLTKKYEALRSSARSRRSPSASDYRFSLTNSSSGSDHGAKLLDDARAADDKGVNATFALPPEWVDIVDTITKDLGKVKENLRTLSKLHHQRLRVTFGDDKVSEQERDIEILTQEITRLLRKSESNLKRIALVGNISGTLTPQEKTQRLNVMRAFASELQSLSKSFRQTQKEFLRQLRDQQQLGATFGFEEIDNKSNAQLDEALDRGLTAAQSRQLQELTQRSDERHKEILKIVQSVSDLASLFRELNVLVIEQGSLLDRIDYNMEQAVLKTKAGTDELERADEYSKKAYTMKCIGILLIILIILIGILVWKHH